MPIHSNSGLPLQPFGSANDVNMTGEVQDLWSDTLFQRINTWTPSWENNCATFRSSSGTFGVGAEKKRTTGVFVGTPNWSGSILNYSASFILSGNDTDLRLTSGIGFTDNPQDANLKLSTCRGFTAHSSPPGS